MANADIKLDDDEIKNIGNDINNYCRDLQGGIDKYIKIMETITTEAVMQGDTSKAIKDFISYAKNLHSVIKNIGVDTNDVCTKFLEKVDDADNVSIGGTSSASISVGFDFSTGRF